MLKWLAQLSIKTTSRGKTVSLGLSEVYHLESYSRSVIAALLNCYMFQWPGGSSNHGQLFVGDKYMV